MMIGGIRRPSAAFGPAVRTATAGFAMPEPTEGLPGLPPAIPPAALGGVLALQEQAADVLRDRQARQHGHALLQALASLQHALLAGGCCAGTLRQLAALADTCPAPSHPGLAAVLQGLSLRAQVELARHGL